MRGDREIVIHTSHHTHYVIGTGANDPQKMDPKASRETLDHSIMYIFAVALQDGRWHHVDSYAPERAGARRHRRAVAQDRDHEDPEWTRRYHSATRTSWPSAAASRSLMKDGTQLVDELGVANAHPNGARPFGAGGVHQQVPHPDRGHHHRRARQNRFLEAVQDLPKLGRRAPALNVALPAGALAERKPGIF